MKRVGATVAVVVFLAGTAPNSTSAAAPAASAVLAADKFLADHGLPPVAGVVPIPKTLEGLVAADRTLAALLSADIGLTLARENRGVYEGLVLAHAQIRGAAAERTISVESASGNFAPSPEDPDILEGTAHVTIAYDVGYSVDLVRSAHLLAGAARAPLQHSGPAPSYFNFKPAPLRILREAPAEHLIESWKTLSSVEAVLYEIGVVQVTYQIPFQGKLSHLARLSELLHENKTLITESRLLVSAMVKELGDAVIRPVLSGTCEDYVIFQIRRFASEGALERLLTHNSQAVAQILRADPKLRSPQEVSDALSTKVSYSDGDLAVPDWAAALLVDPDGSDVRAVLEFAIVQLLEMRMLDARLDDELANWRRKFSKGEHKSRLFFRAGKALNEIGELLVEGAMIKEGINNALKLIGDQYLARLYDQAAKRFHLPTWVDNVEKKLATLESIHDKMEQAHATNHQVRLEWIVIFLILMEIVVSVLQFH